MEGNRVVLAEFKPLRAIANAQLASGYYHTVALKENGTVWAWGINSSQGQLGNNSMTNSNTAVQTVGHNAIGFLNLMQGYPPGDINGDDEVNISDVIRCLRMSIGLPVTIDGEEDTSPYPQWLINRADMNEDSVVNISKSYPRYKPDNNLFKNAAQGMR